MMKTRKARFELTRNETAELVLDVTEEQYAALKSGDCDFEAIFEGGGIDFWSSVCNALDDAWEDTETDAVFLNDEVSKE